MWLDEEEKVCEFKDHVENNYGFYEEEDAFFLLFEELFEHSQGNKKNIYEALRYLLWVRGIEPTYSKIEGLGPRDVHLCGERE